MALIFDCNQCGRCCKQWIITLSIDDAKRIRNLGFKPDYFAEPDASLGNIKFRMKNGSCIFLKKDNSCLIHTKYGYKNKPEVCKHFPYNEMVCGIPRFTKGKRNIEKGKPDSFYIIGKKAVPVEMFSELVSKMHGEQLFDSYLNLLVNILKQKENILIDDFEIKQYNIEASRRLKVYLTELILFRSTNFFPYLNKILRKDVELDLPTQKFQLKFQDAEIPEKVLEQFIPYLKSSIKINSHSLYHLKLLLFFYFLPQFARAIAKDKQIKLVDVIQAFSLLNSVWRFGNSQNPKNDKYYILKTSNELNRLAKSV